MDVMGNVSLNFITPLFTVHSLLANIRTAPFQTLYVKVEAMSHAGSMCFKNAFWPSWQSPYLFKNRVSVCNYSKIHRTVADV